MAARGSKVKGSFAMAQKKPQASSIEFRRNAGAFRYASKAFRFAAGAFHYVAEAARLSHEAPAFRLEAQETPQASSIEILRFQYWRPEVFLGHHASNIGA
jgi:hypothetical protein